MTPKRSIQHTFTKSQQMNAELMAAAEPAIQEAVKQVEKEVRKRFGALVISLIEQQFSVHRNGTDLHIVVHQRPGL